MTICEARTQCIDGTPERCGRAVTLPLANNRRFISSDLGEIQSYMGALFCPHYLAASRDTPSVAFRHYSAGLRDVTFNVIDYGAANGSITVTAPNVGEYYLAQFSLRGLCEINQGSGAIGVGPGALFVIDPDRPLSERMSSGYVHLTMRIRRTALQRVLARDLGFTPDDPVIFSPTAQPLNGASASLLRMVSTVCDDLDSATPGLTQSRVVSHVEDTLLSLLLNTAPHNYSELLGQAASVPVPYYMRRVLNYIAAHAREPITLTDFVEVSGVSVRSLHAGFRNYKDTTPMGYLKAYRLDLARRELAAAEGSGISVTEVALNCGFSHLSKFARDYRLRFGEAPSQTRSGRSC
jgi:AraC-like DNA-binding protein